MNKDIMYKEYTIIKNNQEKIKTAVDLLIDKDLIEEQEVNLQDPYYVKLINKMMVK